MWVKLKIGLFMLLAAVFFIPQAWITPNAQAAAAVGDIVISSSFDTATDGWLKRGSETIVQSISTAQSGAGSLKVTGRTAAWNGPGIYLDSLQKGAAYQFSVYAKLLENTSGSAAIKLTMHQEGLPAGDNQEYKVISTQSVTAGEWVMIQGNMTLDPRAARYQLYVESDSATLSYYIDTFSAKLVSLVRPSLQTDIPSLYKVLEKDFILGAEVQPIDLQGDSGKLLKQHFNSIVAGNQMKPESIQPMEGVFNWGPADEIANFARENNLYMRGHTLVWHQQVPKWFFQDKQGKDLTPSPESKQLVLERLEIHIRTLMNRYKDVVDAWDVVNEVIDPSTNDGMRHSEWYQLTGTDYIDTAFRVAHEVDPNAALFINDYNTESDPKKRQILYDFVKAETAKGVPISGVGHQMHISISYPSIQSVRDTFNLFADLGVKQEVTELDMSVYNGSNQNYNPAPDNVLIQQGERYKELFDMFRSMKDKLSRITFWGMSDDTTWLSGRNGHTLDYPLPFDSQYQAKPAYWGMVDSSHAWPDLEAGLHGPSSVMNGQRFDVTYDLNEESGNVNAQDVTISYDPQQLEFVSADELNDDWRILATSTAISGKIRILAAKIAAVHEVGGDQFKLNWKAKASTSAYISTMELTNITVAGSDGAESNVEGSGYSVQITVNEQTPGDLNNDHRFSIGDLAIVSSYYGKKSSDPNWIEVYMKADMNNDGTVDVVDLAVVARLILQN
ncbi:endo-1,4-beta-xylanase [Paenibacillus aceris]|uniref:Beta-xylanase n=1 Tax=Paenibacillus aceris TaxID=869555 RepID=A0ABS4I4H3_9BACL|nr:endo-1,4-beta-xylanase [Paenibacillus aceris]MBP1965034.1 endo-1,4-beta-xylanase [Paenibacillus aceris]NHW35691.1 hypothetical protein [Paenibacillus aceris]